jgi:hypothetical protein
MYNIEELKKIVRKMRIFLFIFISLFVMGLGAGTWFLYRDPNGWAYLLPFMSCVINIYWTFDTYKDYKEMNNILKQIIRGLKNE